MKPLALYPHRTLTPVAAEDPEAVLRWAGTWLGGEAAHHAATLVHAADLVVAREAKLAELAAAAQQAATWMAAQPVQTVQTGRRTSLAAGEGDAMRILARLRDALDGIDGVAP